VAPFSYMFKPSYASGQKWSSLSLLDSTASDTRQIFLSKTLLSIPASGCYAYGCSPSRPQEYLPIRKPRVVNFDSSLSSGCQFTFFLNDFGSSQLRLLRFLLPVQAHGGGQFRLLQSLLSLKASDIHLDSFIVAQWKLTLCFL